MPEGSWLRAALMAACTAVAASLMLRSRSNCSTTRVEPSDEDEVISFTPAMRPSWRSSGVATVEAIVSGSAPGRLALTVITGKSTCGSGDTGSCVKATAPARHSPMASSVVATGLLMKRADGFISSGEPVEGEIDHRRGEERQHLADDQSAHHRQAERMPQLGAHPAAEHQRQRAEEGRQRGHQDRPEAQQAGLEDGFARALALLALGVE